MNIYGGLIIGQQVTSTNANQVLVTTPPGDLDGFTSIASVRFTLNSTVAGTFIYGLFDADGDPVAGRTFTVNVAANDLIQPIWTNVRDVQGLEFKVVCVNEILTAVVQATINY